MAGIDPLNAAILVLNPVIAAAVPPDFPRPLEGLEKAVPLVSHGVNP
jgi:hypothetical protein